MKLHLRTLFTLVFVTISIAALPLPAPSPPGPPVKAAPHVGEVDKTHAISGQQMPHTTEPQRILKKPAIRTYKQYTEGEPVGASAPKRPPPTFKEPANIAIKQAAKAMDEKKKDAEDRAKGIHKQPKRGGSDRIDISTGEPR